MLMCVTLAPQSLGAQEGASGTCTEGYTEPAQYECAWGTTKTIGSGTAARTITCLKGKECTDVSGQAGGSCALNKDTPGCKAEWVLDDKGNKVAPQLPSPLAPYTSQSNDTLPMDPGLRAQGENIFTTSDIIAKGLDNLSLPENGSLHVVEQTSILDRLMGYRELTPPEAGTAEVRPGFGILDALRNDPNLQGTAWGENTAALPENTPFVLPPSREETFGTPHYDTKVSSESWWDRSLQRAGDVIEWGADSLQRAEERFFSALLNEPERNVPINAETGGNAIDEESRLPPALPRYEYLREQLAVAQRNYEAAQERAAELPLQERERVLFNAATEKRAAELMLQDYTRQTNEATPVSTDDLFEGLSTDQVPQDSEQPTYWLCTKEPCPSNSQGMMRAGLGGLQGENTSLPPLAATTEELRRSIEGGYGGPVPDEIRNARLIAQEELRRAEIAMDSRSFLNQIGDGTGLFESNELQALKAAREKYDALMRAEFAYDPEYQRVMQRARETLAEVRAITADIQALNRELTAENGPLYSRLASFPPANPFALSPDTSRVGDFASPFALREAEPYSRLGNFSPLEPLSIPPLTTRDIAVSVRSISIPVESPSPSPFSLSPANQGLVPVYGVDGTISGWRNWETQELTPVVSAPTTPADPQALPGQPGVPIPLQPNPSPLPPISPHTQATTEVNGVPPYVPTTDTSQNTRTPERTVQGPTTNVSARSGAGASSPFNVLSFLSTLFSYLWENRFGVSASTQRTNTSTGSTASIPSQATSSDPQKCTLSAGIPLYISCLLMR